ncbi:MAG: ABC transporter permease, partial [Longimicrobiales bacterium]
MDEEIRFHLEMRARELVRGGMSPERAWSEAVRRFGDVAVTRAVCVATDERKERRMERRELVREFAGDVVHGVRQLRARPGFALLAVATLAIGIGATTAIFSAADHVILRPLPYHEPERVVTVWETRDRAPGIALEVAPGNFLDWGGRLTAFERFGLAEPYGFDLTSDGPPESLQAWLVTEEFFEALGVRPLLGRLFAPDEFVEGSGVVLLSYGFWQSRFGGDPGIVGRTIRLDGAPVSVAGVLPRTGRGAPPAHRADRRSRCASGRGRHGGGAACRAGVHAAAAVHALRRRSRGSGHAPLDRRGHGHGRGRGGGR